VHPPDRLARWWRWLGPALLALGLALLVPPQLAASGLPMDEGALLLYPHLLAQGMWPISDYQNLYGPANPVVLHMVYAVGPGFDLTLERLTGLVYKGLIVFAVYAVARRRDPVLGFAAGLLSAGLLVSTGPFAYAWYGAVATGTWGVDLLISERRWAQATGAGLLALSSAFRPELAVAALLVIGARALALRPRRHLVIGAAAGFVPLIAWIIGIGPGSFVTHFIGDALRTSAGRTLPLINTWFSHDMLILMTVAAPLILLGIWRRRRDASLVLAVWTIGLLPQALQRADMEHIQGVACVAIPFALVALIPIHQRSARWCLLAGVGAAVTVMALIPSVTRVAGSTLLQTFTGSRPSTVTVERDGRRMVLEVNPSSRNAARAIAMAAQVAPPGARLFVGPSDLRRTAYTDTYVYYLLPQYRPATYFLEMNPGLPNRSGSGLSTQIRSADVVLLDATLNQGMFADTEPGPSLPNRVLARYFCVVARVGPWTVMRPCRPNRNRLDRAS